MIAEKPSVAKAISEVLGAKSKKNGSYEGSGYIVSWCVGHLLELAQPQDYDEKLSKWRYEDLPIAPALWKYIAADSTKKQLKILVDLMKRSDVGEVINACDAGREGELIARLVLRGAFLCPGFIAKKQVKVIAPLSFWMIRARVIPTFGWSLINNYFIVAKINFE